MDKNGFGQESTSNIRQTEHIIESDVTLGK
jgi:hypothetical protein